MAGDLIPPPSPAGRPAPDSMAEIHATAHAQEPPHFAPKAERQPAGPSPFRARFGFVWGVLAGVAVCAAAVTAVLVTAPRDEGPPLAENWSSWKPTTSRMLAGAAEIADHIAPLYRRDSGDQLVAIRASPVEIGSEPLGVAVRPQGGALQVLRGDAVMYGLGRLSTGGKATAKTSAAEDRLLRREALELALYSFRYLDDVTMVAVVLPPPADPSVAQDDSKRSRAILYRPGDLLDQLQVPLSETLSAQTPRPKSMTKSEISRVDALALRNQFVYSIQPLDNERRYLVLVKPDVVD